jgi:hypothetical protein
MIQGEDLALSITVTDSAGVLQDIDAMADVIIYLYSSPRKDVLIKYRKVATAGYTTLLRVSATEYTAILPHTVSSLCSPTNLIGEGQIMETDVRFPLNVRRRKGKGLISDVKDTVIDE